MIDVNSVGKGDTYRHVDRKKWDIGWAIYEKGKEKERKLKENEKASKHSKDR